MTRARLAGTKKLRSGVALLAAAGSIAASLLLSDLESRSGRPETCRSGYEASIEATNPGGSATPGAAVRADRFAAAEAGLVERDLDVDYRVFSNARTSFDVRRINRLWVVTAGTKLAETCGIDAFTGESVDLDEPS